MNQIIYTENYNLEPLKENQDDLSNKTSKKLFKTFFYIIAATSISLTAYYAYYRYDLYQSEKISMSLLEGFNITSLYPSSNYTSVPINRKIKIDSINNLSSSVIGVIEIKKINIVYPILSEINKDYLKISPCKFYGPSPNEVGNLCIAAHNYKNDKFFSQISNLVNGDIITIYDVYKNAVDYVVYDVYTVEATDTNCMNQYTNYSRVVTLVTCDSQDNNYRTIVKAKEL